MKKVYLAIILVLISSCLFSTKQGLFRGWPFEGITVEEVDEMDIPPFGLDLCEEDDFCEEESACCRWIYKLLSFFCSINEGEKAKKDQ